MIDVPGATPTFPLIILVFVDSDPPANVTCVPPITAKLVHWLSLFEDSCASHVGVDNPVSALLGETLPLPDVEGLPLLVADRVGEVADVPVGVSEPDADTPGD